MKRQYLTGMLCMFILLGCNSGNEKTQQGSDVQTTESKSYPATGSIERLQPELDALIPKDAKIEIIAEGFEWSEGPVWVADHDMLLFSDVPENKIFKWTETGGLEEYLSPSGFSGEQIEGEKQEGSNGLLLDAEGRLILCQHGNRQMARMDAPLHQPEPKYISLATAWQNKRFNSPNDAAFDRNADLYFTDPPYGLPKGETDPSREISFHGVYHLSAKTGTVTLLSDALSRPNGIALSPDEKTLYVANSDPNRAIWMAFDLDEGKVSNGRVFFDATDKVGVEKGLPDGLKVDKSGNIWATGPGGVLIFSPQGKHLGTIKTGQGTANCAFNSDQSVFYMTADMYLLRLILK